jgi:hypothetical protein
MCGYSERTEQCAHRYVREGRAEDADVSGTAGDINEPADAIGLHTTLRTNLAPAPTKVLGVPSALRVPRTEAILQ